MHEQLSKLPLEARIEHFKSSRFIDISQGFPIATSGTELATWYQHMFINENKVRFPILGFSDGTVLMQAGHNGTLAHSALLDIVSDKYSEKDITFASAFENLLFTEPSSGHYIVLDTKPKKMYVILQDDSDFYGQSLRGNSGKQILEQIFAMPGVTFKWGY